MDLTEALQSRHSVRSFDSQAVPKEVLDRLFSAAAEAPSAFNEQPWSFIALQGEARESLLSIMAQNTHYLEEFMAVIGREVTDEALAWYTELGGAPTVAVCVMPEPEDDLIRLNRLLSVGAALQNLQLAATDAGVGACTVTFSYWVRDEIAEFLGVDEGDRVVALVALGYPGSAPPIAPPRERDIVTYRS